MPPTDEGSAPGGTAAVKTSLDPELLDRLERFYDAVPRRGARAEEHGPLTLFIRDGEGWPYYARPTRGWDGCPVSVADVDAMRARQRELGIPESVEWVAETTPALRAQVEAAGLEVQEHPLLVLLDGLGAGALRPAPAVGLDGQVSVRMLGPDDDALPAALALPQVAFANPGVEVGVAGAADVVAAVEARVGAGWLRQVAARLRAGVTGIAVAVDGGTVVCSGQYNLVDGTSEIVGVGTLPVARRRGLGTAVTAALVADVTARGATTVFLSASDDRVARIYTRLGFRRVGMALVAEPPS